MKRYIQGRDPSVRVPVREIALSDGTAHTVYDTSGPYTDPSVNLDVRTGLTPLRASWTTGPLVRSTNARRAPSGEYARAVVKAPAGTRSP